MKKFKANKSHGGFELDVKFLTGKSIEFKKSFAFMLLIKKHFTNSVVFNYSPKSLSEKTGISEFIIKKYVKGLVSLGLCQYQRKNLYFVSLNKIMPYRSKKHIISIDEKQTITEIVELLNIIILKNNFAFQDKLRTIKTDLIQSRTPDAKINLKSYKKSKKVAERYPKIKDEKLVDFNVIGMRKLAKILGSSQDYATRFIRILAQKKIIKVKKEIKKYADCVFHGFSSEELKNSINKKSGYFYSFNGRTYHYLGSVIEFI